MRIIFQHIPKTAGSSLIELFLYQHRDEYKFICGKDGVLDNFINLDQNAKNRIKLLIGHVDFGIHEFFDDKSMYITFLRDPVERVVSHYYFIKSNKMHRYHKNANQMNLGEFIISGIRPRMNNCMTRMLSGISPDYNCCREEMIDRALKNIDLHYCFWGFLSILEESVNFLIKKLGWEEVKIPVSNVTPDKPSKDQISDQTLDIIKTYNQLDMKLYNNLMKKYLEINHTSNPCRRK